MGYSDLCPKVSFYFLLRTLYLKSIFSLIFASVQLEEGNRVSAVADIPIQVKVIFHDGSILLLMFVVQIGQKTELDASGTGVIFKVSMTCYTLTFGINLKMVQSPTDGNPGQLVATNDSGQPQGLAIGK